MALYKKCKILNLLSSTWREVEVYFYLLRFKEKLGFVPKKKVKWGENVS